MSLRLNLVRRAAPAGRLHVGVLDGEARPQHVVVDVVDLTALQIRSALAVHVDLDAVGLGDVVVRAGRVVPPELVGHARAPTTYHADPEAPLGLALFEPQVGNLLRSGFGQRDHALLLGGRCRLGRCRVPSMFDRPAIPSKYSRAAGPRGPFRGFRPAAGGGSPRGWPPAPRSP